LQLRPLAIVLIFAGVAHADGILSMRGGYYKEKATRVEQPMIDLHLDVGKYGAVDAHFLVDSITSASSSTGAQNGVSFTERRYKGGLAYTHDVGQGIKLGVEGRFSTESDYDARYVGAHADFALDQQNTTLRLGAGHSFDTVSNAVVAMNSITVPPIDRSLDATLATASLTQVLGRDLVGTITYDFMMLDGFQANMYRVVNGGRQAVPERVPALRVRNAFFAGLRGYIPETRTTIFAGYRFYADDWSITAHTPELRVIETLRDDIDVRLRLRYYTQTNAWFFQDVYTQAQISDPAQFVTTDPKLGSYETATVGGQVGVALSLFGATSELWSKSRVDLIMEYVHQTSSFGDAFVGELGLEVPFRY
jgi:hypothetical protein